jgi:outer membrane immunogenic protein
MKKIFFAAVAVSLLNGLPALAADVPVNATHRKADTPFDWQGPYIGVHAGYGWGHAKWAVTADPTGAFAPGLPVDIDGRLLGGQIGHLWQRGVWVFGLEADYSVSRVAGLSLTSPAGIGFPTRLVSLGTIRGRAGAVSGSLLWYLTGGAAYGHLEGTAADFNEGAIDGLDSAFGKIEKRWGLTAGAGVEWAIATNWTVRAEYLYVNFGEMKFTGTIPADGSIVHARIDTAFHVIRAAVNFRW